jgi:mannitol/fructose-specific phosphotransferase system IIA component (Ntr-type)
MVMRISEGLTDGAVVVRESWQTFEETINGMVARLAATGRLPSTLIDPAVLRICEREAIASTAMVDIGVSIPHARVEGIREIMLAIAVAPGGVYEVAAGAPISIVALVLSSPALTGEHLNVLSSISMLLQSEQTRRRLRDAENPSEVLRLVHEHEGPGARV